MLLKVWDHLQFMCNLCDAKNHFFMIHWKPVFSGKTSDQTVEKYYGELDRKTLDRLYKMYEMDFLLFDYSPLSFYEYVQNSSTALTKLAKKRDTWLEGS